jgi:hypothetical protein
MCADDDNAYARAMARERMFARPTVSRSPNPHGRTPVAPLARFEKLFDKTEGCWIWKGARVQGGYGFFWDGTRRVRANRFAYLTYVGPITDPLMQVCHRCDTPACVNPAHLFLGSAKENAEDRDQKGRGNVVAAHAARRATTVCRHGHRYTEENTRRSRLGTRSCRECRRIAKRNERKSKVTQ